MKVILIVVDSLGVGALPDAHLYGDAGSNTLGHIAEYLEGRLALPNLGQMGLGNIIPVRGTPPLPQSSASYGRGMTFSPGKDTITGHWELMGIHLEKALLTFPEGFPPAVIRLFEEAIGRKILGNVVASGTEIITKLGAEHMRTGHPIVYTSADSVFQLAAHEGIVPIETQYQWCQKARQILQGDLAVARVIARPFLGEPGAFFRTPRRKDYSLAPPGKTLLDILTEEGRNVLAVGKIHDIFSGRGITRTFKTSSNQEGILLTEDLTKGIYQEDTLIFTNLVDFDMVYGHRNDVLGYAKALEEFDTGLLSLKKHMQPQDLLIITADHGCDPTHQGTDHTREYVPVLVQGGSVKGGVNLGTLSTLAHVGATVADYFGITLPEKGQSFLKTIQR
jgi:phosphopentomutase